MDSSKAATHSHDDHSARTCEDGSPDERPLAYLVRAIADCLEAIVDLLFSIRTKSPWLTVREAERYAHMRHGDLRGPLESGTLRSFRRTPKSPVLINVNHINEWIDEYWIPFAPDAEEVGRR